LQRSQQALASAMTKLTSKTVGMAEEQEQPYTLEDL
jgi:hypothetical protein